MGKLGGGVGRVVVGLERVIIVPVVRQTVRNIGGRGMSLRGVGS